MPQNENDRTPPAAAASSSDLAGVEFESAITELEALVDQMETGDLSLEASLAAYERGVRLTRHCQTALRHAELKIKQLTEDDRLETLDPETLDDD
jgi:exodeoxyribonuclease VII small subunit